MIIFTLVFMLQATLVSEKANVVKIDRNSRHYERLDECSESTVIESSCREIKCLPEPRRRCRPEPRRCNPCPPVYNG